MEEDSKWEKPFQWSNISIMGYNKETGEWYIEKEGREEPEFYVKGKYRTYSEIKIIEKEMREELSHIEFFYEHSEHRKEYLEEVK